METLIVDADGKITIPSEILQKYGIRPGDAVALVEAAERWLVYPGGVDTQTLTWWQSLSDAEQQHAIVEARVYETLSAAEREALWNEGAKSLNEAAEDDERELPTP